MAEQQDKNATALNGTDVHALRREALQIAIDCTRFEASAAEIVEAARCFEGYLGESAGRSEAVHAHCQKAWLKWHEGYMDRSIETMKRDLRCMIKSSHVRSL